MERPAVAITRTIAGPWGPLHLAATDRGIAAAESATTAAAFQEAVSRRLRGPVIAEADAALDDPRHALLERAGAAIAAMLDGEAPTTTVPVDLTDRPAWDQRVLLEVHEVPWGETASYGEIARRIGMPRAARAVGGALGRNPVAMLVPCHRIIAADGTIGGYGADAWGSPRAALERKRALLRREGIVIAAAEPRARA
jgi:methylated-DNA-[protein]-cysteine S-methyltransferase